METCILYDRKSIFGENLGNLVGHVVLDSSKTCCGSFQVTFGNRL